VILESQFVIAFDPGDLNMLGSWLFVEEKK